MPPLFNAAALDVLVKRALLDVPENKHGAFLTVANRDGVRAVIAARINGDWTVSAVVEHDWTSHATQYGVTVKGTF